MSVYPYVFWMNFAAIFAGYSLPFVQLVTAFLLIPFCFSLFRFVDVRSLGVVLFVCLFVCLVIFFRVSVYHENVEFISYRTFFLFIVYSFSLLYIICGNDVRSRFSNILLFNIVFQAVFGITHSYFFPHIVTGIELDDSGAGMYILEPGEGGFRESGMLLGSNVYGNFLVLGLFLTLGKLRNISLKLCLLYVVLSILIFWAISLSGSRLALANALVIAFLLLVRRFGIKYFYIPTVIVVGLIVSTPIIDNAKERTANHGASSRLEKSEIAINMLDESFVSTLLGPTVETVSTTRTSDGLPFSDNSYMLLSLTYGIPVAIICFTLVICLISRNLMFDFNAGLFLFYFLTTLMFNNAVLWDIWLCYAVAIIYIISGRTSFKFNR